MEYRKIIKSLIPPILVYGYNALRQRTPQGLYLKGDYTSWTEALAVSTGYDSEIILAKTRKALLKVKTGRAVYERDSVLFDEIQYAWPLLAGLLWAAARSGGRLNVLDFGGSLGSSYFQNRKFLQGLNSVHWNIVEQPQYIHVGKDDFECEHLKFYPDIATCLAENLPNVIILSGVLQCLESPSDVLRTLLSCPCDHLIIDRTPFWDGSTDRLCVQYVPPSIYPASYPSWIFSTSRFHSYLNKEWDIIAEFTDPDRLPGPVEFAYRGMIAIRRPA